METEAKQKAIHNLEALKSDILSKIKSLEEDYSILDSAINVIIKRETKPLLKYQPVVEIPNVPPEEFIPNPPEKITGAQELSLSRIPTNHVITQYSVRFKRSDKLKLFKVEKREHKHILMCFNEAGEFESEVNLKEYAQDICTQVRQKLYNHKTAGDKIHIHEDKPISWLKS